MLFILGVLGAVLVMGLSIALHEIGHLVPAKRFGVRVTQYMVGFGPTIWSRRRGETEYGLKAVPLGGYIRMIGMFPPPTGAPEGSAGRGSTGRMALLVEDARRQSWEEVDPADADRVFYKLPVHKKIVVMLGGPVMNLLIAFGLFAVLLIGIGIPTPGTKVAEVIGCVPSLDSKATTTAELCPPGSPPSPAAAGGLKAGDRITALNGTPVDTWEEITTVTRAVPARPVTLRVDRGGEDLTLSITPVEIVRPEFVDGKPTGQSQTTGYVGMRPDFEYVSQPLSMVPRVMWDMTVRSATAMVTLPQKVWELAKTLVNDGERDPDGPVSVVGVGRISGEIAASNDTFISKFSTFISLMAGLNLFLFLFNLLPVLPLDGGHVAGALYEGLRRRWARLRGRPDPGFVDVARAMPLAYAVAGTLILVSSVVILADLFKPITLPG